MTAPDATIPAGPGGWIRLRHRPATNTHCHTITITTGGIATQINNADDLREHGRLYHQACDHLAQLLPPKPTPHDHTPTLFEATA